MKGYSSKICFIGAIGFKPGGKEGEILLREQLGELWDIFKKMMSDLKLPIDDLDDFDFVLRTLNPLSHDNLAKPIYKKELETAFELLQRLQNIQKKQLIKAKEEVIIRTNNSIVRQTFLRSENDVFIFKQVRVDGAIKFALSEGALFPLRYEELGTITPIQLPHSDFMQAFNKVYHHVFNIANASERINYLDFFYLKDQGLSIQQLINRM